MYNGVIRALQQLGLSDAYGATRVPLQVLNITYPLVSEEVIDFCRDKRAVLIVEEGQPEFIEQAISTLLRRTQLQTRLHGKDMLPMAGEYTATVLQAGIARFLDEASPALLAIARRFQTHRSFFSHPRFGDWLKRVPPRPPGFCTGCPERPIFAAMKLVEKELGAHHVLGRHRLPSLFHSAALQHRHHHHGLWARSRRRVCLQRPGGKARHLGHGRTAASGITVSQLRWAMRSTTSMMG